MRRLVLLIGTALAATSVLCCGGGSKAGSAGAFTLTVTPANITLTPGAASQNASLLLNAPAGSGAVAVTVSHLPSGVTITPASLSLSPGVPLPVAISANASAVAATTMVSFTAVLGTQTATAQTSLLVQPPPQDFSLTVTPAATTLVSDGTPATLSLLATAQNGFAASVPITITGLPAGVVAQPASLTLTPGTAATVTLTAATGTATGAATVTFTGVAGSLTHTASVALTIAAPATATADFALTLAPQTLTLSPGSGAAVQVTATALNGFAGTPVVTVTGLPAGVTGSPASLPLPVGTPQTLTLTAGNTAAATTGTVIVTATSGTLTHSASLALTVATAGTSVSTYHNDNARDGWDSTETVLTPQTVSASTFGKIRELPVDGKVDAQPLYVSNLAIAGQTHNVLIAVTEHASAFAFDADGGAQLWHTSTLAANETSSDDHGCNQISPEIGITATPVIDRGYGSNGAVFLVAMSRDAQGAYHQRLHALDLTTGAELAGSPTEIQATYPGTGYGSSNGMQIFAPGQYAERVGMLLMNGEIYLAWTSHCDQDPYTGWLMAYSESTLQQTGVFNMTPNGPSSPHFANGEGSVWMSGAGLGGDTQGNIYFLDANGTFDTSLDGNGFPSQGNFGNSFLKISTNANKLAAADYFAVSNTQAESDADQDLGSGGVLLLPDLVDAGGVTRQLAVGAGKDKNIYVVDRSNMGKFNPSSNSAVYQQVPSALSGAVFSAPAYANNTVYYAAVGDHLKAIPVTQAKLASAAATQSASTFAFPGATPSISSNGSENGIVWAIENQNPTGVLHAYDATNLASELYNSTQAAGSRDSFVYNKYVPPMIANGKVFVGTTSSVAVFGLLP